jgi:hypothetical protein
LKAIHTGSLYQEISLMIPFPVPIPIPFNSTTYTFIARGQALKLVRCENCSTEYVYALEREGEGVGTADLLVGDDRAAQTRAKTDAREALHAYLQNDFDAVPCPACGHYQRHMLSKLYESSPKLQAARLGALAGGILGVIVALSRSLAHLQYPGDHTLGRMVLAWVAAMVLGLLAVGLGMVERSRVRRFDPNAGDCQARIKEGRRRAVTRAEFIAAQRQAAAPPEREADTGAEPG